MNRNDLELVIRRELDELVSPSAFVTAVLAAADAYAASECLNALEAVDTMEATS